MTASTPSPFAQQFCERLDALERAVCETRRIAETLRKPKDKWTSGLWDSWIEALNLAFAVDECFRLPPVTASDESVTK